jgi:hypothetical protein
MTLDRTYSGKYIAIRAYLRRLTKLLSKEKLTRKIRVILLEPLKLQFCALIDRYNKRAGI